MRRAGSSRRMSHFAGKVLKHMTETDFTHAPLKGAGLSKQALAAGAGTGELRYHACSDGVRQVRPPARVSGVHEQPARFAARCTDGGRGRRARLDDVELVRRVRSRAHAGCDRGRAPRVGEPRAESAGCEGGLQPSAGEPRQGRPSQPSAGKTYNLDRSHSSLERFAPNEKSTSRRCRRVT